MKQVMKKQFLFIVVMVTSIATFAQQNALSLQQCIETAWQQSIAVKQNVVQQQIGAINLQQAKLNRLPTANGGINHGINRGRSIDPFSNSFINQQIGFAGYGLSSDVVLFNGMSLQNTVKQNSLTYAATQQETQQSKDNIAINVTLAYLQVLMADDMLNLAKQQQALSLSQVERLTVLNREGAIPPAQLYDLQGQYAGDQLAVVNAQNAVTTAKLALCQQMNITFNADLLLQRIDLAQYVSVYNDAPGGIYETALLQLAQFKAAALRIQSAQTGVKATKGRLYPVVSLGASANTNYSSVATRDVFVNSSFVNSDDYVVVSGSNVPVVRRQNFFKSEKINYTGQLNNNLFSTAAINIRVPLFNGLQAKNAVKLAQLEVKRNELTLENSKLQLQQNIEQTYMNMTAASQRYTLLKEQVAAFTASFNAAEVRFNNGVGNSIDYLTARTNMDRANLNFIMTAYDAVLRVKLLDFYKGKQLW
jgi:outer membrane protein